MDLKLYKKLYKKYSKLPLPREVWDSAEHEEYMNAFHNDKECQEWELKERIKKAGIDIKKFCCINMAYHLIEDKKSRKTGNIEYDSVIAYSPKRKTFGLPIHDGGGSWISISYCPWCGSKL